MIIGVITFWFGNSNYGMILQCWALQTYLKRLGNNAYLIRYIPPIVESRRNKILRILGILNIYNKWINKNRKFEINNERRDFNYFRNNFLSFSPLLYKSLKELQNNPPKADCYITGSDQVWAQLLSNENNQSYFLDFGSESTKRIAYAPSFSMNNYPEELRGILYENLKRFTAISVREYEGINICSSVGINAQKVVDPTLLLNKEDYLKLCQNVAVGNEKTIFIYSLNLSSPNDIRFDELDLFIKNQYTAIVTPSDGYFPGEEIFPSTVKYIYSTPQEWIAQIRDAEMVITPSFHGVVLSIILERPFVYVPLTGKYSKGNNRILELLRDLNMENRVLSDDHPYSYYFNSKIDWSDVSIRLDKYRCSSIDFLEKNLK